MKTIVFCIDGCTFPFVEQLAMDSAFMNLVCSSTRYGPLEVPVPASTSVGFPTFFTGRNLGKIGAFQDHDLGDKIFGEDYIQRAFLNGLKAVKGDALWDIVNREDMETISFNVPITYPAKEINGVMISSFDSVGNMWTHPIKMAQELKKFWEPTSEIQSVNDGEVAKFWEDRLQQETEIASGLVTNFDWDLSIIAFLQLDRVKHKMLARYYSDYSARVLIERMYIKIFKSVVTVLGKAYEKYGKENVTFFIMSDHGFHITEKHLGINCLFYKKGWLKVNNPAGEKVIDNYPEPLVSRNIDMEKTKVWTSGQGLVTINDERFTGVVDDPNFVDEVKLYLEEFTDPLTDINVVKEVRTKEEEWSGDTLYMPDLVCVPTLGFELHTPNISTITMRRNTPKITSPEGSYHYYNNGFYATDFRSTAKHSANIYELAPTILEALGIKIPADMDSAPLPKSL